MTRPSMTLALVGQQVEAMDEIEKLVEQLAAVERHGIPAQLVLIRLAVCLQEHNDQAPGKGTAELLSAAVYSAQMLGMSEVEVAAIVRDLYADPIDPKHVLVMGGGS